MDYDQQVNSRIPPLQAPLQQVSPGTRPADLVCAAAAVTAVHGPLKTGPSRKARLREMPQSAIYIATVLVCCFAFEN